jgi:hypothetical protein
VGLDRLAARLADGDPRAALDLVEGYYAEPYRYAFAILRGGKDAEDAGQDAFERALTALGWYPEERIRAIAPCVVVSYNRERGAQLAPAEPRGGGWGRPRSVVGRAGYRDRREAGGRYGRAGDAGVFLPERQRMALTLRYVQDLPYAEICAATGWPRTRPRH